MDRIYKVHTIVLSESRSQVVLAPADENPGNETLVLTAKDTFLLDHYKHGKLYQVRISEQPDGIPQTN